MKSVAILLIGTWLAVVGHSQAGTGEWTSTGIFQQEPLEVRMGPASLGNEPDLIVMILWNDGVMNQLTSVLVPPPYDGSSTTTTSLDSSSVLFALGDVCTTDSAVYVPYVKDFDVEVAVFTGGVWTTSKIAGTDTNQFDSADCAVTAQGVIFSAHDLTDSEVEFFRPPTRRAATYTFYARYGDTLGPFDGAIRDSIAGNRDSDQAHSIAQEGGGMVQIKYFDASEANPSFNEIDVEQFTPPATFTFVKEVCTSAYLLRTYYTFNADGTARTAQVDNGSFGLTENNLGAVSNNGTQFNFQGCGILPVEDLAGTPMHQNVLWGDYFIIEGDQLLGTDPDYPLRGVGGPVDACLQHNTNSPLPGSVGYFAGPRVDGTVGTDIHMRTIAGDRITSYRFEGNPVSTFFCD